MTVLASLVRADVSTEPYHRPPLAMRIASTLMRPLGPLREAYLDRTVRVLAQDILARPHPSTVTEMLEEEQARLVRGERAQPYSRALLSDDAFLKDIGIARGILWPVGVDLLESASPGSAQHFAEGEPWCERSAATSEEFVHSEASFLHTHLWQRYHGRGGFSHTNLRNSHLWAATFLEADPSLWGLVGRSWFLDPALPVKHDKPGLWEERYRHGAALVLGPHDDSARKMALLDSPLRQAAYAAGTYVPRWCSLLWPRAEVIDWATDVLAAAGRERPQYAWELLPPRS